MLSVLEMMEEAEKVLAYVKDKRDFIPSYDSGVVSIQIRDTNLVTFYPSRKIAEFPPKYNIEFEEQRRRIMENLLELGYTIQK